MGKLVVPVLGVKVRNSIDCRRTGERREGMRRLNWCIALLWGFIGVAVPAVFAAENIYTGSSDGDLFPATMDGGASITYQADTITFGTLPHPGNYIPPGDSVALPGADKRGFGDFEYTMDLAMTDLDGMVGFYAQGITVDLLGDAITLAWREDSEGDYGAYVENKCVVLWPFDQPEISVCDLEGAGAGDISLRLSKSGKVVTAAYLPNGGTWTTLSSVDVTTKGHSGTTEWSLRVYNYGEDGFAFGTTNHVVDEIGVSYTPVAENLYMGSDDPVLFPATMDGGASITYQADTITFGTLPHPGNYIPPGDSVALPAADKMGFGDVEYTMDLAMHDLDGLVGFYAQGITVDLSGDAITLAWREDSEGDYGAYVENKCVVLWPFDQPETSICDLEGVGAGNISLRLSKIRQRRNGVLSAQRRRMDDPFKCRCDGKGPRRSDRMDPSRL